MITDWIPTAERLQITGCTGPGITQFGEWSVTLHTLEGSIATALRLFQERPCYCPHLTIAPKSRRVVQHIPLSWPAAALNNDTGGVETNRAREIQIEIEGFAAEAHLWPDDELAFIGGVLADVVACGVPINLDHHPRFVGTEAGFIARKDAPQRMSPAAWYAFDGVCGHQHVPENDHWDPGRLDIDTVIRHAKARLGQPDNDEEGELMAAIDDIRTEFTNQDARTRATLQKLDYDQKLFLIDIRDQLATFVDERTDQVMAALVDTKAITQDVADRIKAGLTPLPAIKLDPPEAAA